MNISETINFIRSEWNGQAFLDSKSKDTKDPNDVQFLIKTIDGIKSQINQLKNSGSDTGIVFYATGSPYNGLTYHRLAVELI